MFEDKVIDKVPNPLKITKSALMEFKVGELHNTGLYRFKKIIEISVDGRSIVRYLIYSNVDDAEYIFEVFPGNGDKLEAYVYTLDDTVPFSEDFLEVAGQRFLNTPQGDEYQRCVMPDEEDRIEGIKGRVRVFDIETEAIEKTYGVQLWDYQREVDGRTEFLNIEMDEAIGLFKIFTGELIEDIFYKVYTSSK